MVHMEQKLSLSLFYLMLFGWCLTLIDGAATVVWLNSGIAVEGNPLLSNLMDFVGIAWAMLIRVLIGLSLLLLLYSFAHKGYDLARYGILFVTTVLTFLVGYHSYGVWLLLSS